MAYRVTNINCILMSVVAVLPIYDSYSQQVKLFLTHAFAHRNEIIADWMLYLSLTKLHLHTGAPVVNGPTNIHAIL